MPDPHARDPYGQQPQVYGYDAYGSPVHSPDDPRMAYDAYGRPLAGLDASAQGQVSGQDYWQGAGQGYGGYGGYDPYAVGGQGVGVQGVGGQGIGMQGVGGQGVGMQGVGGQGGCQQAQEYPSYQEQHQQQGYVQVQPQPQPPSPSSDRNAGQERPQERVPRQAHRAAGRPETPGGSPGGAEGAAPAGVVPEPRQAPDDDPAYHTEQFSFVEAPDEDAEDVIDWLKFSESRTERRDERRRRGRNRYVALAVAFVLVLGGVLGYLFLSGGDGDGGTAAGTGQKRDVIVVHLRQTRGGGSSTALLVDNATTKKATAVLLPNSLAVAKEGGGATTLGKSVQEAGTGGTRDALNTLLGSRIKGSWRLDTPYLENLVQLVGGVTVDVDADVPGAKPGDDPLVRRGGGQSLNGQAAVAYATHRVPGEAPERQLGRFGQVMQAVLKKMSTDPKAATTTVEALAQIPDPSLSVPQLGASLAQLAARAKAGAYRTTVLPVRQDGTLGGEEADGVVKEVLGGAVGSAGAGTTPRVSVKNATGGTAGAGAARVALVNGGYTYLDAGTAAAAGASAVYYADDRRAADAKEVAKTLGLPAGAVRKGSGSDVAANADVTVVLGRNYKG
ncbi:LCP family glycopolymer transferase [Streptomyces huiliensis]|uniref:LCP family glycopolymer transferase n=1 Tax=Streptomyces huiliensis TaxID=2876027 RepID=UPI001CBC5D48|nr:LCP family protein [Streptomyces huiliensis]